MAKETSLETKKKEKAQIIKDRRERIDRAKAWEGLPEQIELVTAKDKDGNEYAYCRRCAGPEKSAVNRFHAFICPTHNTVF